MALGQHTARMHAERGRVLVSEKVEERARDSRGEESLREERRESDGRKVIGSRGERERDKFTGRNVGEFTPTRALSSRHRVRETSM